MKFVAGLRGGRPEKIGMRIGVVANDVAAGSGFTEEFGMLADVLADDEESRTRFMTVEEIEEFGSHGGIGSIVKRDRELARRVCVRDCGTKDF